MATLYFIIVHESIKKYVLECKETDKIFKSLEGSVFMRNTFKKSEENTILEGYFNGSWFMYSTDKDKLKNMKDDIYNKAVNYHNSIISKHQKTLIALGIAFENKEQISGNYF